MTRAARVEKAVERAVEERVVWMAAVAVRVAAALAVAAPGLEETRAAAALAARVVVVRWVVRVVAERVAMD